VDASVFPTIPSVNPVGTVMALAERASDLIITDSRV
jgi:choline dehydrogenase-like flavoprotein